MKVLHVNAGLEEGGAKTHILSLLSQFPIGEVELLVLEEGSISKEARLIDIKVHVLNQQSRYDLTILKRLVKHIKDNHFDIVHTHGARANLLMALIKKKINVPWITTVHSDPVLDFMDKGIKGKVFSYLNIWSLKKADKLIVVTESLKVDLIKRGLSKQTIFVVYNGIIFDKGISKKQQNKAFTITCVARLHPVKAHEFLFESLKYSGLTDFHLNIIGDGELRKKLERKVSELDFEKLVQFHGTLEKRAIENILHQSDLTVLSSLSEGFPLVLLESANQKVPFITTDVGDCAKLVPDSSYGWVIPSQDKGAFSTALLEAHELWRSNKLVEKGKKLHHLASKEYSLREMYFNTLFVYKSKEAIK